MKRKTVNDDNRGAITDRKLRKMIEVGVRRGMPPISVEGLRSLLEEALEKAACEGLIKPAGVDDRGRTVYESLIYKPESKDG